jgi:hypothetical protein
LIETSEKLFGQVREILGSDVKVPVRKATVKQQSEEQRNLNESD